MRAQRSSPLPLFRWFGYLGGLIPVLIVVLIRLWLWPVVEQRSPFLLLALAVLVAAWFGGRGPGLIATAAGALMGWYFLLEPRFSFQLAQPQQAFELAFFVLVGAGITLMSQRVKSAKRAADETARHSIEILESIRDGFVAIDRYHRFTYVNPAAEEMLGKSTADLAGKRPEDVYPQIADTLLETECLRAAREQAAVHFEYCDPDSGRWADVSAYPSVDGGLLIYFRENTERKRNERALSQLAAIVDSSEDPIISVDLNGTILTWNAAAERIYGYSAEEAKGRSIVMTVPPDRREEENGIMAKVNRGERLEHFETVRIRKDGKLIQVSVTISPIRDKQGAVVGASGIVRDITERKALEAQLRQTAKLESLGVLAGGIAHDFNNLLVGILGNASLATEVTPLLGPARPLLEQVITASERAATLTQQLLAYSGRGRFVVEPVDLSALVREMSSLVQASVSKTVQLRLELAAGLPAITADAAQMQQLVMNLVINGAEAIGDRSGCVTVTTRTEYVDELGAISSNQQISPGHYVLLTVEDDGVGMDEATAGKIFDPFFTTKFTGRGLGLSAVLGIVRGHKGAIQVSSSPGQGSVFRVLLPAAQEQIAAPEAREASPDPTGSGAILVVDDEEIVRRTATMALERRGYSVMVAVNGQEAVDLFRKCSGQISLVLLDLSMPVMSGEECLARLKELQPGLRVILSSGFSEAEAIRRFRGGVKGFLQKPYTAARLAEQVKVTLSSTA
jgi:PAS domain S-box-containing protein